MMRILALVLTLLAVECYGKSVVRTAADKWEYVGCYKDQRPRDLTSSHKYVSRVTGMNIQRCFEFCEKYHTLYMALQTGNECRCDNGYGRYGKAKEDDCDEPCTKDDTQKCGGSFRNSIYKIRDRAATEITANMMRLKTGDKLVFTALGDWGYEGTPQKDVAKQLGAWSEKHNSAFTAAIGDNFYNYGVSSVKDSKFQTTWKNVYTHKALQHPWLIIEGNHDYLMGNAPYQVMYAEQDKRWVMPSLYYSMHYSVGDQDVHFIFLDTDPIRRDYEHHQYEWFRKEIGGSKSDWVIVIGHHPVGSSGSHGSESSTASMYDNIRYEMVKRKAALYICGHDHLLQHLVDRSGVVDYVISGAGSKTRSGSSSSATRNLKKKKITSKFLKTDYGFVGFELKGNQITVSYIDGDGKEVYSFTKTNPRAKRGADSVVG